MSDNGTHPLSLPKLGLGGTGLGNMYEAVDNTAASDLIAVAYAEGIRYFDTAPCYGFGLSEQRLGQGLASLPSKDICISTKVGYRLVPLSPGETLEAVWQNTPRYRAEFDFSYDGAIDSLEESLSRLRVGRVSMVAIHDPDEAVGSNPHGGSESRSHFREAMEGSYRALDDLRSRGVIDAVGIGITQWQMLIDFAREGDFDYFLLAGRYTLLEQEALETLFPVCERRNIKVIIGGPYNSGILATGAVPGAYYNYTPAGPAILDRVSKIEKVCSHFGVSLRAAALQFPLGHPVVASVIPGARSADELKENIRAAREPIPAAFWAALKAEKLVAQDSPTPTA